MAETLTYDPGTDTVTVGDNLTPDEQDSLQVGEELESQQEQLLAGKYENAQELERAYIELQKKLGEEPDDTASTEEPEQVTNEEPSDLYLEDGAVNYEEVSNTYGEKLGEVFQNANLDPWAISQHFHENKGSITDEMFTSLVDAGLSEAAVTSYLAGRAAEMGYTGSDGGSVPDLSDAEVNIIKQTAGGDQEYASIMDWANETLSDNEVQAYDDLISTGNVNAIQMAVTGLKAKYDEANGYEGRMLQGKAPRTSREGFRSQAELVEAMSDPRYDRDPAYRQDVIEKLDQSDIQF